MQIKDDELLVSEVYQFLDEVELLVIQIILDDELTDDELEEVQIIDID